MNKITGTILGILGIGIAMAAGVQDSSVSAVNVNNKYNDAPVIRERYDFTNNVLETKKENEDDIQVRIGRKGANFVPEMEITRWNDEVSFRIKPEIKAGNKNVSFTGKEVKYEMSGVDYKFYDIEATTTVPEGGYEWEIILKSKPATSTFYTDIESEGLEFHFQISLTDEDNGYECNELQCLDNNGDIAISRNVNIVDSYAVYHSAKTGDYTALGGKNYKAGKAFHIYRIKCIDANEDWIWGTQHIENGIWSKTCDSKWLDNAEYPVIVDPTFGYTSIGSSNEVSRNNYGLGTNYAATQDGEISKITVYVNSAGPDETKATAAIYKYFSTEDFVATTSEVIITSLGSSWVDFSFISNPSVSDTLEYALVAKGTKNTAGTSDSLYMVRDSSASGFYRIWPKTDDYPDFPSVLDPYVETDGERFSIYATYAETDYYEVDKDFSTCSSSTDCWARRGHSTSTLAGYATTILPNIDRDDWGFTSSSGTTSEDYTALQYSQIDTDDTDWATTSATEFGDSNIFIWRPIYNEYEIKVNRHPGLWANLNIETIGFLDPYATASATSTAAEDVYMYVYNAEEDEMEIVDSKLNGTCIGSATADCTLTFTTTTDIQDYFVATGTQWIIRYGVSMIDVGSDCVSYEGGNIICGKFKYGTTSVGTYQSIGCEPQTSSEDLHNQCPTTGCYKGNCNGAITPNPVGSLDPFYSCGVYADDLRNNCNVCEYCAAAPDASTSCALADTNFWEIEQYGCTGPCNSCENGACTDTKCEGSTCGCLDDELCISGVCTAQAPPNCPSTCAGLGYGSGFCAYDSYQCPVPPFFRDGTAGNCQAPDYCCCYY